jgi:hypothetical protein
MSCTRSLVICVRPGCSPQTARCGQREARRWSAVAHGFPAFPYGGGAGFELTQGARDLEGRRRVAGGQECSGGLGNGERLGLGVEGGGDVATPWQNPEAAAVAIEAGPPGGLSRLRWGLRCVQDMCQRLSLPNVSTAYSRTS